MTKRLVKQVAYNVHYKGTKRGWKGDPDLKPLAVIQHSKLEEPPPSQDGSIQVNSDEGVDALKYKSADYKIVP